MAVMRAYADIFSLKFSKAISISYTYNYNGPTDNSNLSTVQFTDGINKFAKLDYLQKVNFHLVQCFLTED